MLKTSLHKSMYGLDAPHLETDEVYNLAIPGATIDDIRGRLEIEISNRQKTNRDMQIILGLGSNDTKGVGSPENVVTSADKYKGKVDDFLRQLLTYSRDISVVGVTPVDESKTTPKQNPFTGQSSYFFNERIEQYERLMQSVCEKHNISFLPTFKAALSEDWIEKYTYVDGLHPNTAGHQWLHEKITEFLDCPS